MSINLGIGWLCKTPDSNVLHSSPFKIFHVIVLKRAQNGSAQEKARLFIEIDIKSRQVR